MARELTPKQKMFVAEYLIDLNATQAAIRAGYSEKTAYSIGEENLRKPEIQEAIQKSQNKRAEKLELSAEWVLQRLKDISDRCIQAEPVLDREGNPIGEYRFDSAGANKATELIGKHLKLFTDKVEHSGTITLEDALGELDE
ncbi:MAG: terminase small subunit [Thermincolia bacterium]